MIESIGEIHSASGDTMFKMWRVLVPPGKRALRRHSHFQFEIAMVAAGGGTYTIRGKQYPMREKDFYIFSSNEMHCITDVGPGGMQLINIHFEPRYMWGHSTESLSSEYSNLCFSHAQSFENRIPSAQTEVLTDLVSQIVEEFSRQDVEYPLMVKSLLNRFIVLLIRDFNYADHMESVNRSHLSCIRRVVSYIDTHLDESLTLALLAQIADISPTYFSSLFHKINNITLWDYIRFKRIDKAIQLLTEGAGTATMLEIAMQCGYNNSANFNKAFLAQTGMTPTQYRKSSGLKIS